MLFVISWSYYSVQQSPRAARRRASESHYPSNRQNSSTVKPAAWMIPRNVPDLRGLLP
jgi:hypothetical protein